MKGQKRPHNWVSCRSRHEGRPPSRPAPPAYTGKTPTFGTGCLPLGYGSLRMMAVPDLEENRNMSATERKKIGILVVAYNAATTLAKVLDRIPIEIYPAIEEVIVSDDHSQDSTYLVGLQYQQISKLPITLIRQPTNLGYGGNQKVGYDLAIEHGLDIVVMLHGDGQYAAGVPSANSRATSRRRSRCGFRITHDGEGGCSTGRNASLEFHREPDLVEVRECCPGY